MTRCRCYTGDPWAPGLGSCKHGQHQNLELRIYSARRKGHEDLPENCSAAHRRRISVGRSTGRPRSGHRNGFTHASAEGADPARGHAARPGSEHGGSTHGASRSGAGTWRGRTARSGTCRRNRARCGYRNARGRPSLAPCGLSGACDECGTGRCAGSVDPNAAVSSPVLPLVPGYWTPERMAEAKPMPMPTPSTSKPA